MVTIFNRGYLEPPEVIILDADQKNYILWRMTNWFLTYEELLLTVQISRRSNGFRNKKNIGCFSKAFTLPHGHSFFDFFLQTGCNDIFCSEHPCTNNVLF